MKAPLGTNASRKRKRKLCAHLTPLPTGLEGSCGNCPLNQPSLGNLHAWPLHSELLGKGWAGMKRALLRNYRNVKSLLWNRLQIGGEIYQMLDFIHLFNSPQPEILFKIIWASNETKPHCVFLKLKSKPFFLIRTPIVVQKDSIYVIVFPGKAILFIFIPMRGKWLSLFQHTEWNHVYMLL